MSPAQGYNADQRAQERESGPVVIGGQTYHPKRLTNKTLRRIRQMSRTAGREAEKLSTETDEYREAYDQAKDDGLEEKEAVERAKDAGLTSDIVQDLNMESLAEQLSLLLVDDNQQLLTKERALEHLDEDLDSRDVEGLMTYLLGTPDPTPSEPTTGSAS